MKWVWIVGGVILGLISLVYGIGLLLPVAHVAERQTYLSVSPESAFDRIRDFQNWPQWRPSVTRIVMEEGGQFFTEDGANGVIRYEVVESRRPERLVNRIADESLPFGGQWTITLTPKPGGCEVAIREDGIVKSPVFRFFSSFVFGHTKTMEGYLSDLEKSFRP